MLNNYKWPLIFLVVAIILVFVILYRFSIVKTSQSAINLPAAEVLSPVWPIDSRQPTIREDSPSIPTNTDQITPDQVTDHIFIANFNLSASVKEAAKPQLSSDHNWWVNSGGYLYITNGIAKTIQGELPENDERRLTYFQTNPSETDNGYHPQNIFRLVTKSQWQNYAQQVYFRITKDNLSPDSNRDASNGLLLFNRYQDGQNLYYTGIRVDGNVVIKKKIHGNYYTMAINNYFPGHSYHRDTNPNLLPKFAWIGLQTEVTTDASGRVVIKLFVDPNNSGQWDQVLTAIDDGNSYGGKPILDPGYAGIRTDFMDVEFRDYQIKEDSIY